VVCFSSFFLSGLSLFFFFSFLNTRVPFLDVNSIEISETFWDGYDRVAEMEQKREEDISLAREQTPDESPRQTKRGRLNVDQVAKMRSVLTANPSSSVPNLIQLAQRQGVTLDKLQMDRWFRNAKKKT